MAIDHIGTGDGSSKENAITIQNFDDLRTVNKTENLGKYVKLLNDINVSEESWYMGSTDGWSSSLSPTYTINCRFFSDSDSPKTISGLTIVNAGFLTGALTNTSLKPGFEYVNLIDCCFKCNIATTSTAVVIGGLTSITGQLVFDHCNMSVFIVDNTAKMRLFSNSGTSAFSITDSTIYLKHKLNNTIFNIALDTYANITRSTIILDGFSIDTYVYGTGDKSSSCLLRTTGKKISSALIFRNCNFATLLYSGRCYWLYQSSEGNNSELQSYYAFDNCTFADGYPLPVFGSVSSRLVASNYQGTAFTHDVSSGSVADSTILATMVDSTDPNFNTSSIKSQQFLVDSGFLP